MKTIEEIKRELSDGIPAHFHSDGDFRITPLKYWYFNCLLHDVIEYIKQFEENLDMYSKIDNARIANIQYLESRLYQLEHDACNWKNEASILKEKLTKAEKERDVAFELLGKMKGDY